MKVTATARDYQQGDSADGYLVGKLTGEATMTSLKADGIEVRIQKSYDDKLGCYIPQVFVWFDALSEGDRSVDPVKVLLDEDNVLGVRYGDRSIISKKL